MSPKGAGVYTSRAGVYKYLVCPRAFSSPAVYRGTAVGRVAGRWRAVSRRVARWAAEGAAWATAARRRGETRRGRRRRGRAALPPAVPPAPAPLGTARAAAAASSRRTWAAASSCGATRAPPTTCSAAAQAPLLSRSGRVAPRSPASRVEAIYSRRGEHRHSASTPLMATVAMATLRRHMVAGAAAPTESPARPSGCSGRGSSRRRARRPC